MPENKDKKPFDKKSAPAANTAPLETIIGIILILVVVSTLIERIYSFSSTARVTFYGIPITGESAIFQSNLPLIKTISFVLSGLFAFGAVVFSQLRGTIWISERKKLFPDGEPTVIGGNVEVRNQMADKWQQVLKHMESSHPSDWRLAIIEADVMLSELLEKLNLPGDTMGDKMKAVERSDFTTIDLAWEAHKIRNQIAHEGSEFLLNQREARRVVLLYNQVFKEFFMI